MAGTEQAGDVIRHLRGELERHPPDRYPVQHATARFHLGTVLLEIGRAADAEASLRQAAALFPALSVERAKALNMVGVALRGEGRPDEAAEAFAEAAAAFAAAGQPVEEAAATFNLGLVKVEVGAHRDAIAGFRRARTLFLEHRLPLQGAAAARELGSALLSAGESDEAVEVLEQAMTEADRHGDRATLGSAANALGLAHLAADRPLEAVELLRAAAGALPRGVRPDAHAMAKANLALAYDAVGDAARARLAGRQARDTPGAPAAVVAQAEGILARLGPGPHDLLVALDDEPVERWPAVVREEVVRWVDAPEDEQRRAAAALVEGQLQRPARATEIAEAWLTVLLELPPQAMEAVARRLLEALGEHDHDDRARFQAAVAGATARFHVPQLLRLRDTFAGIAEELGLEGSWR